MYAQALIPALLLLCIAPPVSLPRQEQEQEQTPPDEPETPVPVLDPKVEAERLQLETEYFATTDYNGDGWISYREGQSALLMTRASFAQYDIDGNGRVTQEEFKRRYRELLDLTGAFRRPTPQGVSIPDQNPVGAEVADSDRPIDLASLLAETTGPLFTSPEAFVGEYDENVDGRLSAQELVKASEALGFDFGASGEATLATLDKDGSGFAEPSELAGALAAFGIMSAAGTAPTLPKAKSIEELFGGGEVRKGYAGSTPRPPYFKGPVRPFRRLDINDSGAIEVVDLEKLSVSAHPRIRPAAVIATLDLDGDGELSQDEFAAAFDD